MPSKTRPARASRRKSSPLTPREKVRAHRARLRAQGLRPITIWVPDTRSLRFLSEARRQARLIAKSPYQESDQEFIDAISEWKPD
jgi:hypothetical protein